MEMDFMENFEKRFFSVLHSEIGLLCMLFAAFVVQYFWYLLVGDNPTDNVGYGWFLLFGGWLFFIPVIAFFLTSLGLYIRLIIIREKYFKMCLDPTVKKEDTLFLVYASRIIVYSILVIMFASSFSRNVTLISVAIMGIDILIQQSLFAKLTQSTDWRWMK